MKSLLLVRHAKSEWGQPPGVADHDRPLAPRGRLAAPLMGAHLAGGDWRPQHVLCSSAARARETLELLRSAWELGAVPTEFERDLYLCGAAAYFRRLRRLPDAVDRVMLVGHNPDCHDFARQFAGDAAAGLAQRVEEKFPTGAAARFDLRIERWEELDAARSRLVAFTVPRQLA
ncbi:MAG TPA: histidine phosphatase family protein [Alphaproteobacteria bacterium]|nr:histidine phosphatase family protein [Alphaproteobacteria bacterium]